jgi:ATP-dependent exoDNAse (exonuclease V) alpha subunit
MSDDPVQLTKWQNKGMNSMMNDIENLVNGKPHNIGTFIVGPGGTGKSYLLDKFKEAVRQRFPNLRIATTATTGAAASRLNGATTLAKWLCIGAHSMKLDKYDEVWKFIKQLCPRTINETRILIIDEVSMLSERAFDNLNRLCREYRKKPQEWGGIYVILVGDPLQLPPVPHDAGPGVYRKVTEFVPSCLERQYAGYNYVVANQMKRSEGSVVLQQILLSIISDDSDVREEGLRKLVELRYKREYSIEEALELQKETGATILTTVKEGDSSVTHYNSVARQLNESDGTIVCEEFTLPPVEKTHDGLPKEERSNMLKLIGGENGLHSEEKCIHDRDTWPKDGIIRTKTPYMIRANLVTEEGVSVCNGDQGEVLAYDANKKTIRFQLYKSRQIITLPIHTFHSEWVENIGFKAFPLIESAAMTVHKSQGATLNGIIFDPARLYNGAYLGHMLYTAFSRVKSIDDIHLASYILPNQLEHPAVKEKLSYVWQLDYMNEYLRPTDV